MFIVEIKSDGGKETLGKGIVVNMSAGGFQVETETVLQEGGKYHYVFEIPIEYAGEVAWNKAKGQMHQYGIKFAGLSFLDKFILKKFLKGPRRNRHV